MSKDPTNGLVLSGGGARGAYEVGVMKFIREKLAKRLGKQIPFPIITGTSVGALNGAFLAGSANDLNTQTEHLAQSWQSLELDGLITMAPADVFRVGRQLLGRKVAPPPPGSYSYGGILNTHGLEQFVCKEVPWSGIRGCLRSGALHALAITATHVGTGHTVIFLDKRGPVPEWSHNPYIRVRKVPIGPRHALASAAIPVLFPAVKVGRAFYVDGGLRNNTPMSPAIRLGANRLLVVSLRHRATQRDEEAKAHMHEAAFPNPLFLMGKALNALMLDPTEYDIQRLESINDILEVGTREFGPRFAEVMANGELHGSPLRRVEAVHIQPSIDVGEIASNVIKRSAPKVRSRFTRTLLRRILDNESTNEADTLSYLLFDGEFASELIHLGFRDAEAYEDELVRVFAPEAG